MKIVFNKRHYEYFAHMVNAIPESARLSKDEIARHFANYLYATNPRFDAGKFIEACLTGKHIRKTISDK